MSDGTRIEWAEASWNPIKADNRFTGKTGWHCEILTPGCERCYAQAMNKRLGTSWPYLKTARQHVSIHLDEKTLTQPMRWKRPRRIFVCSMSDLFGEWVTDDMLRKVLRAMEEAPQHSYQILTKRAERQRDFMQWWVMDRLDQPPPNWWLGVSVEDQRRADERIPMLLDTPAAVRWISAEPCLAPIDLERGGFSLLAPVTSPTGKRSPGLNWVVVGGESGPGARPFNIEWARSIMEQCKAAGVQYFLKQIGAKPVATGHWKQEIQLKPRDRKGGDISEFPIDLRVRQYPVEGRAR